MNWFLIALMVLLTGLFLYWLFVVTEGVYLGRKVVIWLYDVTARKYDDIKQYDVEHERQTITEPLLRELRHENNSWVLDVATGTGRVPSLLLNSPGFSGRIVGLDAAGEMLAVASAKLAELPGDTGCRPMLIQQTAVPLPFRDDIFSAVSCLEALEFFPTDTTALEEIVRVLRPGGFLMTTRRRGYEARFFPGRFRPPEKFEKLLKDLGMVEVKSHFWQVNYDLVTARKSIDPT